MTKLSSVLAFLVTVLTPVALVLATTPEEQETLRELSGVAVVIEPLKPEIEQQGFHRDQLQRDVELSLRQAGIKVLTEEERLKAAGHPYLYVNVNVHPRGLQGVHAVGIHVSLEQEVILRRKPTIAINTTTWKTGGVSAATAKGLLGIRRHVSDYVQEFIRDYLAVNPK